MKAIEGMTEENGSVFYEYNGEKIDLTAIGDECGTLHMTKAIKILMEKTGLGRREANDIMYQAYRKTPPNRKKIEMYEEAKNLIKASRKQ